MDIGGILSSINIVTLIAFIITLGVLVYEIRFLIKDRRTKKSDAPVIPTFDPNQGPQPMVAATPIVEKEKDIKKNPFLHRIIFIILVIMLFVFGFLSVSSLFAPKQSNKTIKEPQVAVQEVQSSGIKIYNVNWEEITGDTTDTLKSGDRIYVGVAMIVGSDIDKARIKVNSTEWSINDITADYNSQYNVFYKPYIIKENETKLDIEAQLYSKTKGWLSQ